MTFLSFKNWWSELDTSTQRRLRNFQLPSHMMQEWREPQEFSTIMFKTMPQSSFLHNMRISSSQPKIQLQLEPKTKRLLTSRRIMTRSLLAPWVRVWSDFPNKLWVTERRQMAMTTSMTTMKSMPLTEISPILITPCSMFLTSSRATLSRWRETTWKLGIFSIERLRRCGQDYRKWLQRTKMILRDSCMHSRLWALPRLRTNKLGNRFSKMSQDWLSRKICQEPRRYWTVSQVLLIKVTKQKTLRKLRNNYLINSKKLAFMICLLTTS
jgi:hypothetical protein